MGHDAYSCDILPSDDNSQYHFQEDVLNVINREKWDMMIAFPPCTHLANSGARWFKNKVKEQSEALDFIRFLMNADIPKIAIENPVGVISTKIRKPDQIIQPYWFGDRARKTTCLWLKGLPNLEPTKMVEPDLVTYTRKDGTKVTFSSDYGGSGEGSGKRRSLTYQGIADAMASQWSC